MNIKKPLLVAGVVTSVGLAGLGGNAFVSAASNTSSNDSLAAKIAQKFNLKTEDVQSVINEDRTAKQTEHQAEVEKTLTQAVTDKKITSEQKDKILAKQKELQAKRESEKDSMKSKTEAERKAAMDANRTDLEKWASDNGIPKEYLKYVMGHGGRGMGDHGKRDNSSQQ